MDNTIIAALIGVVGGLFGVWIGGIISRRSSREAITASNKNALNLVNRQEFFRASEKFIMAFLEALTGLEYDGQKKVYDIITPELINHKKAFVIFRRYLEGDILRAFEIAWNDYFPHANSVTNGLKHNYSEWKEDDERKLMIEKIENLLSFARFKHDKPHEK